MPGAGAEVRMAVAFARVLRRAGVDVPTGSVVAFTEAMAASGLATRERTYWAGRLTLVRSPEEIPVYDGVFAAFWEGAAPDVREPEAGQHVQLALDEDRDGVARRHELRGRVLSVRYSPVETLRHRDFASLSKKELAETYRAIDRMKLRPPTRASGRRVPARRRGRYLDMRRTVHGSLRSGAEVALLVPADRAQRRRQIVILCDVSGSMEPYSRALLRFVHAAVVGQGRVQAFALGTRLTPISRELAWRDPDAALSRAAAAVKDWSGGTRLGECLAEFNRRFGMRGVARGAVVVVLSDGWDRGAPELLAAEMARLARVASRVVWVNPLKAAPGYAPTARGMAAALPWVDDFVEGHSLASLEDLAEVIAG